MNILLENILRSTKERKNIDTHIDCISIVDERRGKFSGMSGKTFESIAMLSYVPRLH